MIKEQSGEISSVEPGKEDIFPVLALINYPSLPKIRHSHANKNYLVEMSKTKAITSQRLVLLPTKL